MRKKIVGNARRIVIKIGSSVLAGRVDDGEFITKPFFSQITAEVKKLREEGKEVVIVSSGALAFGMRIVGFTERPKTIPEMQAASAVGQSFLIDSYRGHFENAGANVAQILLTHDDLSDRNRFLNARNTLMALLDMGVVPIINENDTVAVEEIKFGDNDALAALTTNLVEADLLILLTDVEGLFDKNPHRFKDAKRIDFVEDVNKLDIDSMCTQSTRFGTGGIVSKVEAARKAAHFGTATVVASGFEKDIIGKILAGDNVGTFFLPREDKKTSKKHWIAFSTRPKGKLVLDDGAVGALISDGKSLLPSGITAVEGEFRSGEAVELSGIDGVVIARGITNYDSREIGLIKGRKSGEIEEILGYKVYDEVIHRDNLSSV